jgi:hypothetical protein
VDQFVSSGEVLKYWKCTAEGEIPGYPGCSKAGFQHTIQILDQKKIDKPKTKRENERERKKKDMWRNQMK